MSIEPNSAKSRAYWTACGLFAATTICLITLACSQRLHYAYALGAGGALGLSCGFFWLARQVKKLESARFVGQLYELEPVDESMQEAEAYMQSGAGDD